MALTAQFKADFSSFTDAVAKAQVSLRSFETGAASVEKSLNRMSNAFTGVKVVQDAKVMAAAVERVGGAATLTEAEMRKMTRAMADADTKMKALGQSSASSAAFMGAFQKSNQQTAESFRALFTSQQSTIKANGESAESFRRLFTVTGAGATQVRALSAAQSALLGTQSLLNSSIVRYASAAVVGAAISSTLTYANSIETLAAATGAGIQGAQTLENIAVSTNTSVHALASGTNELARRLADGDKSAVSAMARLGINTREFVALRADQQFIAVAKALGNVSDQGQKAALAKDLFRNWQEVIVAMRSDVDKLSTSVANMSDEDVKNIAAVKNAWDAALLAAQRYGAWVLSMAVPKGPSPWVSAAGERMGSAAFVGWGMGDGGVPGLPPAPGMPGQANLNRNKQGFIPIAQTFTSMTDVNAALGGQTLDQQIAANVARIEHDTIIKAIQKADAEGLQFVWQRRLALNNIPNQFGSPLPADIKSSDTIMRGASSLDFNRWLTSQVPEMSSRSFGTGFSNVNESEFQKWFASAAQKYNLDPNPDSPDGFYDWRGAFRAGASPEFLESTGHFHWPSDFKKPGHENEIVGGFNTRTGARVPGSTQASEQELITMGWSPEAARQLTRGTFAAPPTLPSSSINGITLGTGPVSLKGTSSIPKPGFFSGAMDPKLLSDAVMGAVMGGGNVSASVGGTLAGGAAERLMKTSIGTTLGKSLGGVMGSILPGIGNILGALAGSAIGRLFGGSEESKKVNPVRDRFFEDQGGLGAFNAKLGTDSFAKDIFAAKTVEQYEKAIRSATKALDDYDQKQKDAEKTAKEMAHDADLWANRQNTIDSAMAQYGNTVERVDKLLKKYKFTQAEAAPVQNQMHINQGSAELLNDWQMLIGIGVDESVVNKRFADPFSKMLSSAKKTGAELPSAMKPVLEKLLEMGLLTDGAGKKLEELGDIKFGQTLPESLDALTRMVQNLIDTINGVPVTFPGGQPRPPAPPPGTTPTPAPDAPVPGDVNGDGYAHTGGYIGWSGLKRYHTGGLLGDERPFVGLVGEGVINRMGMSRIGERGLSAINSGAMFDDGGRSVSREWESAPVNQPYIPQAPSSSGVNVSVDARGAWFDGQGVAELSKRIREEVAQGGSSQTAWRGSIGRANTRADARGRRGR